MTTTELPYSSSLNKLSAQNARASYKISINDGSRLSYSLDIRQRGGQGLGKQHRVRGLYIDKARRVYAEFMLTDSSGHSYRYAAVGRLHPLGEEAI